MSPDQVLKDLIAKSGLKVHDGPHSVTVDKSVVYLLDRQGVVHRVEVARP